MDTIDSIKDNGRQPLANRRHEAFCLAYSGKCWGYAGTAYVAAGYRPRTAESARAAGYRLLSNVHGIRDRVDFLRDETIWALAFDRYEILKLRKAICDDPDAPVAVRLAALRDIEKSLGLATAEKVVHEHQGAIQHKVAVKLDDEVLATMQAHVQVLQDAWDQYQQEIPTSPGPRVGVAETSSNSMAVGRDNCGCQ